MSQLVVCGLNYRSSPLSIREQFVIPDSCVDHALAALARYPEIEESVVLSTCNRTEVYAVVTRLDSGLKKIEEFFRYAQDIADHEALKPDFRLIRDDVCLHLMRVAAGLDSMVLGEPQILCQIKKAHKAALNAGNAGTILNRLFQMAQETGKRVRSETAIGQCGMGLGSVAIDMARQVLEPLEQVDATVIGAGSMARECIESLTSRKGTMPITVTNRTEKRLYELATKYGSQISTEFSFDNLHDVAARSRLIIMTTSAPQYVLKYEDFLAVRQDKYDHKTLIVDLSVPRNVDPRIAEIDGVVLRHAEDLAPQLSRNQRERETLVEEAEEIVFETLERFRDWQKSRKVVPTIVRLRQRLERIREEHLVCGNGEPEPEEKTSEISRAIVNEILHNPTVTLKSIKDEHHQKEQARLLEALFRLE